MEVFFIDEKLKKYILSLDKPTIAKFYRITKLLQEFGYNLGMPYSKKFSGNIYEIRVRGVQELRVFYCFYKNQAWLIHAFIKKSQKTPSHELETAKNRMKLLTGT